MCSISFHLCLLWVGCSLNEHYVGSYFKQMYPNSILLVWLGKFSYVKRTHSVPFCYLLGQQHFENKAEINRSYMWTPFIIYDYISWSECKSSRKTSCLTLYQFSKNIDFSPHCNFFLCIRGKIVCFVCNGSCFLHFLMSAI